jgi:hypothetical protein
MWLGAHQAINEIETEIKLHWIYKKNDLCKEGKKNSLTLIVGCVLNGQVATKPTMI